ncbi:hypothetical protein [Herpetosiphon llansteffanensis]|uniref:hypothetical protein n=1 Tax=Herpetosiphon llansteffanensis TaxID=2094568 RepID=UPI000D7C6429|nr:hypothetical protein [Herpetosiphon llansteffanensis]
MNSTPTPISNPAPVEYPQTKPDSLILPYGVPHVQFAQHWVRIESYDRTSEMMMVEIRPDRDTPGVEQALKVGDSLLINNQRYQVLALQAPQNGLGWIEIDSQPQP